MSPCDIPECFTEFVTSSDTTNFTRSIKEEGTTPDPSMKWRARGRRSRIDRQRACSRQRWIPPTARYPVLKGGNDTRRFVRSVGLSISVPFARSFPGGTGSVRQVQNDERSVVREISCPMGSNLCDETPRGLASRHVLKPLEGLHEPGVAEELASVWPSLHDSV